MSDIKLLQDYALRDSEEAFASLVQRHIGLVYSAAMRQLGNTHQAEEVTQAVFIILARKADGFPHGVPLAGWLYETTRLTTANFRRSEWRRSQREQEAYMQAEFRESLHEQVWENLAPLLDEAMGCLNGQERHAVVARYFEGRTFAEAALALGANEAVIQKRTSRAVEKLRRFFARRGMKISAAVLVGSIAANSLQAAPVGLAVSVTTTAVVKGATAGSSTLTLVNGALKIMVWTKIKTAAVIGTGALLFVATGVTVNLLRDHTIHGIPPDWKILTGDTNAWSVAKGNIIAHNEHNDSLLVSSQEYADFTVSVTATCRTREASLALRMKDANNGYLLVFGALGTPWAKDNGGHVALIRRSVKDRQTNKCWPSIKESS